MEGRAQGSASGSGAWILRGQTPDQDQQVVVKNTFITVVDRANASEGTSSHSRGMQHSRSDSDLSSSHSHHFGSSRSTSSSVRGSSQDIEDNSGGEGPPPAGGPSGRGRGRARRGDAEAPSAEGAGDARDAEKAEKERLRSVSVGSELHGTGRCRPCKYVGMAGGCAAKQDCLFCHVGHRRARARPAKSTRARCKELVNNLPAEDAQGAGAIEDLAGRSPYLRGLLKARYQQVQDGQAQAPQQQASSSSSASVVRTGPVPGSSHPGGGQSVAGVLSGGADPVSPKRSPQRMDQLQRMIQSL